MHESRRPFPAAAITPAIRYKASAPFPDRDRLVDPPNMERRGASLGVYAGRANRFGGCLAIRMAISPRLARSGFLSMTLVSG